MLEDIVPRVTRASSSAANAPIWATVPCQFLELIEGEDREPFNEGSGRLSCPIDRQQGQLRPPAVNRCGYGICEGIVRTPSDFGLQ